MDIIIVWFYGELADYNNNLGDEFVFLKQIEENSVGFFIITYLIFFLRKIRYSTYAALDTKKKYFNNDRIELN